MTVFVSADTILGWQSERGSPVILDCRSRLGQPDAGRQLYNDGHIKGALFADLETDLADLALGPGRHPLPDPDHFVSTVKRWGIGDAPVVVYDDMSGAMAARAWWMLRWIGVSNVFILDGGFDAWGQADGPLSQDSTMPTPSGFTATLNSMPVTNGDQINRWVDGATSSVEPLLLLDARAGERFRGEVEPIDQRAGHVPGASNRPFADSLCDGRVLEDEALRDSWRDTLGNHKPSQVTHMCGSGVTACLNLAFMEHLEMNGSSLYVDSWSGWIASHHS